MFRRSGAVALLALAVTAGSALSATAAAPTLKCGDKVTADLVLRKDLTCTGTALHLVIPMNGTLKVDLNGHRLKGNGTGTGLETKLFASSGTVVVTNGTITGFAEALVGPAQSSAGLMALTARNVKFLTNGSWLPAGVQRDVLIDKSLMIDSGQGRGRVDSQRFVVQNSELIRSSISSASETNNYLYNNSFDGGGFFAGYSSNVTATGNTFRDCDTGIRLVQNDIYATRIENNTFKHCQIGVRFDDGIFGSVTVKNNYFIENMVTGMTYLNAYNQALTITGNSFLRNVGDGLKGADTRPTSGSAPAAGPTLISGNNAIGNGGWGIYAAGVVKDGGNNFARRNGQSAQCTGVVCR